MFISLIKVHLVTFILTIFLVVCATFITLCLAQPQNSPKIDITTDVDLFSPSPGVSESQERAEYYNELGLRARAENTVYSRREAVQFFLKAIQSDPNNEKYHLNLAELYLTMKFYSQAQHFSNRALSINHESARAYYILGRIAEAKMLKYMSMIDPSYPGSGLWFHYNTRIDRLRTTALNDKVGIIWFNKFADKDKQEAVSMYEKSNSFGSIILSSLPPLSYGFFRVK